MRFAPAKPGGALGLAQHVAHPPGEHAAIGTLRMGSLERKSGCSDHAFQAGEIGSPPVGRIAVAFVTFEEPRIGE